MTTATPSFTERVRQELSRIDPEAACDRRAELAALVRMGGTIHLHFGAGDPLRVEIATTSGAVARRVFRLVESIHGVRPELRVEERRGIRSRPRYELVVADGARPVATDAGLLDADGRPSDRFDAGRVARACDARAYVRGALLAAGSLSRPGRAPHLEIAAGSRAVADGLAATVASILGRDVTAGEGKAGWRVVLKSGEAIGELLAEVGATQSFLAWDERRLRGELRAQATRLSNADAANVRRSVAAASAQVREVGRALEVLDVDTLADELREIALVRLANPAATLAELGELCDPPVGKSTVHRRLERLRRLAIAAEAGGDGG